MPYYNRFSYTAEIHTEPEYNLEMDNINTIDQRYLYMYNPKNDYLSKAACFLGKGVYGNIEKVCNTAFEYLELSSEKYSIVSRADVFPRQDKLKFDKQFPVQYICVENKYKKCWDLYRRYFTHKRNRTQVLSDCQDSGSDFARYVSDRQSLINDFHDKCISSDYDSESDSEAVDCLYIDYDRIELHLLIGADQRYLYIYSGDCSCAITRCRIPDDIYDDAEKVLQLAGKFSGPDPSSIAVVARKNDLPAKYSSKFDKKYDTMYVMVRYYAVDSWNTYCFRHNYDYKIEPFSPDPTLSESENDEDDDSDEFIRNIDQRYLYIFNGNRYDCTKSRCLLGEKRYGDVANVLQCASEYLTKDPSSIVIVCRKDIFPRQDKIDFDRKYDTMYICVMKLYILEWNEYSAENKLNLELDCSEMPE